MKSIWLVGTGNMGLEYVKVLKDINISFTVIGRGEKSAKAFADASGVTPITGGIDNFVSGNPDTATHAIIATGIGQLKESCLAVIKYGVKNILLEKPGGRDVAELEEIYREADVRGAKVYIAYNRRFYSSLLEAEKYIKEDDGITSLNFEFTEWGHFIEKLDNPNKDIWFFANSTHVVDMAFFLGGFPVELSAYAKGENSWHRPLVFAGSGITQKNSLFSYCANWEAPGRWGVEIMTKKHRLIFRPLEKLQIQEIGSINTAFVDIDDSLDVKYKHGLFLQTREFLEGPTCRMCTLRQQIDHAVMYKIILGEK